MKLTKHKGYTVYSNGLIKKKRGDGYIRPGLVHDGYLVFNVAENGKHKSEYIHRFIWQAFNGPIPNGFEIDHIDNNPANNRLYNLRLLTNVENASRGTQKFTQSQLDEIKYLRKELGWTQRNIAERFGVSQRTICYLEKKGFRYEYAAV